MRHGTALVASAGKTIEDVVERVATMADVVGEIARDAQEQCVGIETVARKIAEVETSNSENVSLLAQARESAHELQMLAGELGGAVGRFRIDKARGPHEKPCQAAAFARKRCLTPFLAARGCSEHRGRDQRNQHAHRETSR